MISVEEIGQVTKYHLARSLAGRGWYFTSCYRVGGLLIDTGCAHTAWELLRELQGVPIELIVNTHSHEDHIGANGALQTRCRAEVRAHRLALPVLAAPKKRLALRAYQKLMWGYPQPSEGLPLGEEVVAGRLRLQVISAPGHSPDHVCFYEPRRQWLFTGDAFIGGRDRALRQDYNVWQIIASLRKMSALKVSLLFPASGNVRVNPQKDILRKIGYLEQLCEETLARHEQGLSVREIHREIFGREMPLAYFTLGHFSGKNLIRSIIRDEVDRAGP
jgi:glyoxylase-like metal-dependent hydrolase (beta-lactamase superfamily II)